MCVSVGDRTNHGDDMSLLDPIPDPKDNPVDIVEHLAALNDWTFERSGDDEISISVSGRWADYHVSFSWMQDIDALHTACAFDLKVPPGRRASMLELLAMINEQMWVGHFDLWTKEGVVMFRHALLLPEGTDASGQQCLRALDAAVEACERYYQAFQFVVWAGKSAREAMDAALFETVGEA